MDGLFRGVKDIRFDLSSRSSTGSNTSSELAPCILPTTARQIIGLREDMIIIRDCKAHPAFIKVVNLLDSPSRREGETFLGLYQGLVGLGGLLYLLFERQAILL